MQRAARVCTHARTLGGDGQAEAGGVGGGAVGGEVAGSIGQAGGVGLALALRQQRRPAVGIALLQQIGLGQHIAGAVAADAVDEEQLGGGGGSCGGDGQGAAEERNPHCDGAPTVLYCLIDGLLVQLSYTLIKTAADLSPECVESRGHQGFRSCRALKSRGQVHL